MYPITTALGDHDSAPNKELGIDKYRTYVAKILRYSGYKAALDFLSKLKRIDSDIHSEVFNDFVLKNNSKDVGFNVREKDRLRAEARLEKKNYCSNNNLQ